MMQPKVSIIIPVYNVEKKLLCKCLDSLLNQTLNEIELICVLDCPTDGTDKVVEEYAQKDSRIKIVRNEQNLHIGESRNRGIEAATGEFIGFFDDDDYCEPDMYEKLYHSTKQSNSKAALCERSIEFMSSGFIHAFHDKKNADISHCIKKLLINDNNSSAILVWNYIYNRKFILENNLRFVDTKQISAEDALFNVSALLLMRELGENLAYVPEVLYHHLYHKGNTGATIGYMNKLPIFREELTTFITKHYNTPENRHNTHIGNIVILYRVARLYAKREGLSASIKQIKNITTYKGILQLQKTEIRIWEKELSLPKNILNWIIKLIS